MKQKAKPDPTSRAATLKLSRFLAQECRCAACEGLMHLRTIPANDPELAVYRAEGKTLVHVKCREAE